MRTKKITLKKYSLALASIKKNGSDTIALGKELASIIDKLNDKKIDKLSVKQLEAYAKDFAEAIEQTKSPLKEVLRINGKLYGFEPCVEEMESGAYTDICDLTKAIEEGDNLARVMAIMYRPIKKNSIFAKRAFNIISYVDEPKREFEERVKLFNEELYVNEVIGMLSFFLNERKV